MNSSRKDMSHHVVPGFGRSPHLLSSRGDSVRRMILKPSSLDDEIGENFQASWMGLARRCYGCQSSVPSRALRCVGPVRDGWAY